MKGNKDKASEWVRLSLIGILTLTVNIVSIGVIYHFTQQTATGVIKPIKLWLVVSYMSSISLVCILVLLYSIPSKH